MNETVSLKQQLEAFENGTMLASDGRKDDNGCWNFYDWFCEETSLKAKSERLMRMVKRFVKAHPELNLNTHYVWFKNNCPMNGPLYDDIRISDMLSGNNVWVITSKSRYIGKAKLYKAPNYNTPYREGKTFSDLLK